MNNLLRYTLLLLLARGGHLGMDGVLVAGATMLRITKVVSEGCIDEVCICLDDENQM